LTDLDRSSGHMLSHAWSVGWWALLAAVFVTPLAIGNFTFLPGVLAPAFSGPLIVKVFTLGVLTAISLAAWALDVTFNRGRIRYTPVGWLVLGLLAWVAVSTAFSIHPPTAILGQPGRYEGLFAFVNYALVFHLVLQYADVPARVRSLSTALVWSSALIAGYGLMQFLGVDPTDWGQLAFESQRAFSTYGNPDVLGGFLMFSVPLSLGLALSERRVGRRLTYLIVFGVNVLCLIVTFTRGAWIGGVVGLGLVSVMAWRSSARLTRVDWAVFATTAVAVIVTVGRSLSSPSDVLNIATRLGSIFEVGSGSGLTRTQIMRAAVDAIVQRPLLGYGADTFRFVFQTFKPVEYVRAAGALSIADNAHSYPLHLAVGIGVVGVVLLFGAMTWGAARSAASAFARTEDARRLVFGSWWAAGVAYLTQMLFGLSTPGATFLLWIALGVVLSPSAREWRVPALLWTRVVAASVATLCAIVVALQILSLVADRHYQLSNTTDIDARIDHAIQAARLNPWSFRYRGEVGLARAQDYVAAADQARAAEQQGVAVTPYRLIERQKFLEAESALGEMIRFAPQVPETYVFLATVYNLAAQSLDPSLSEQAIATAQDALVVDPFGLPIRVQLAQALAATGETEQAISTLEYALRLDPNFTEAAALLETLEGR